MSDGRFDHSTTTTCGYCGVGCRLEAHERGGRIVSISPPIDGPANHGHTCVKGRFAHQFTRSRDRLTAPLVREGGGFRLASWEEAIDRVAEAFRRSRPSTAPTRSPASPPRGRRTRTATRCSALIAGGDRHPQHRQLLARLPLADLVRAPQVARALGRTGSFADFEAAEVLLLIGSNPTAGHPVVGGADQAGGAARPAG